MDRIDAIWSVLIGYGYFTEEELKLITNINGYNEHTLNDCMHVRYGYNDIEQLLTEDGLKSVLKDYHLLEDQEDEDGKDNE